MQPVVERLTENGKRLWAGTVLSLLIGLVVGSLAFPRLVYDRFIWQYFWGPVQADALNAVCATRSGGAVTYLRSQSACNTAAQPVAYPGYTVVSEIGYVIILLLALIGVLFLIERLAIEIDRRLYFALFPFMLFGGALRTVEDAADAVPTAAAPISYPWTAPLISPFIYFTVFVIVLASLLASVYLLRRGVVDSYERPLFVAGSAALALAVGYLLALAALGVPSVEFYPQVTAVVLVGSTISAGIVWLLIERFAPAINAGTGWMGALMLWGHAVDGVANVIALDWMIELGAGQELVPKHPVNDWIVTTMSTTLPESVISVTGSAWPFLVVKLAAATFIIWIFDEQIIEESPRYAILLLITALAVGLGPGTRDMLRATFGI
jgi:uncharacterized membrane protein